MFVPILWLMLASDPSSNPFSIPTQATGKVLLSALLGSVMETASVPAL
jgi:hypothetical protein